MGGGELDGECQPIEPAADLGNRRGVGVAERKGLVALQGTLDEELDRRKRSAPRWRRTSSPSSGTARPGNRRTRSPLRRSGSRLVTRISTYRCVPANDPVDAGGDAVDDMLAAVEDQQHVLVAQILGERFEHVGRGRRQSDRGGDGAGDEAGIIEQGRQIDEPDAIARLTEALLGHRQRDSRLADPAGADDRKQGVHRAVRAPIASIDRFAARRCG